MTSPFDATEQRLDLTCARHPEFARQPAVIVRLIKHLYKRAHDQANQVLRPWGINHAEYNILIMLYGSAGYSLSPTALADAAMEKSTNVTRLTDGLCGRGLIERVPDDSDRRRLKVTLTEAGLAMVEDFLPAIDALLQRQSAGVDGADLARLETLLKQFLESIERV